MRILKKRILILGILIIIAGAISCARMAYDRAEKYASQGEFELALAEFQRLIQKYPNSSYASIATQRILALNEIIRSRHLQASGKDAEEHEDYERAVNDYREALILAMKYKLPEVDTLRQKLIKAQNHLARNLIKQAEDQYNLKKYENAMRLLDRASKMADEETLKLVAEKMEQVVETYQEEELLRREAARKEDVAKWKAKAEETPAPSSPKAKPTIEVIRGGQKGKTGEGLSKLPGGKLPEGPPGQAIEYYKRLFEEMRKGN